jgi:hypothetical protein
MVFKLSWKKRPVEARKDLGSTPRETTRTMGQTMPSLVGGNGKSPPKKLFRAMLAWNSGGTKALTACSIPVSTDL